ncbi:MAG: ATP-grasp domain-containing protein [ANME-2 cluster archaeon]|nr:ATP-grasp domain-containing protein [ANME-2 cluster archaeon]
MKILVLGINTRHIACSAARAGYTVHTLSSFNDIDLMECAAKNSVCEIPDVHCLDLEEIAATISSLLPVDGVVLGPGFEHLGHWIDEITHTRIPVFNNVPETIAQVSNKVWLAHKLRSWDIRHPHTLPLASISTQKDWNMGYPAMIKPICGAGGVDNILVRDADDLADVLDTIGRYKDKFLIQEFFKGTLVSVSVISTKKQATAIAINEQLAGLDWLTDIPFAYCGNITPHESEYGKWICDTAVELAVKLKLLGSNGVDFIITEHGPVVLEINPRFQGSIDTVENATGINVFQSHIEAFEGLVPLPTNYLNYSVKAIFFAPHRFIAGKKVYEYLLQCLRSGNAADVPLEDTVFEKNEPVVSFLASGKSRRQVVMQAGHLVDGLVEKMEECNTED